MSKYIYFWSVEFFLLFFLFCVYNTDFNIIDLWHYIFVNKKRLFEYLSCVSKIDSFFTGNVVIGYAGRHLGSSPK